MVNPIHTDTIIMNSPLCTMRASFKKESTYVNWYACKIRILHVNEKLPVMKFRYFGKYIIQLFGYCYFHVSGQRQAGL